MKTTSIAAALVVSVGLTLGVVAQAAEHKGETVKMNSLPSDVQKTIQEKAAGGEVVRVMREDDPNGRWNYEVVVKSSGKQWQFEVDPKGKFVKKTGEAKQ